jgi:hypothetical protein
LMLITPIAFRSKQKMNVLPCDNYVLAVIVDANTTVFTNSFTRHYYGNDCSSALEQYPIVLFTTLSLVNIIAFIFLS